MMRLLSRGSIPLHRLDHISCLRRSNLSLNAQIPVGLILNKRKVNASSHSTNVTQPSKGQSSINIPNILTLGRIAATPYLSYLIMNNEMEKAVGGISDWMDGYIARNYNQKTVVGSFLDPMADKVMVGVLSITMAYQELLPISLVTLMFGRDIFLVAGTLFHRARTKTIDTPFFSTQDAMSFQIQPTLLSKVNTGLQFALIGLGLVNGTWNMPGDDAMMGLSVVVGMTTMSSGLQYARDYIRRYGSFVPIRKH